jgi:hypothetical protein
VLSNGEGSQKKSIGSKSSYDEKAEEETTTMITKETPLTPAKRKRLLKLFGACPAGYTTKELEQFLDLLYGMYSNVYTLAELHQVMISDPFDRSEMPRQIKLMDLTDWLEAVVS